MAKSLAIPKTTMANAQTVEQNWYVIDADGLVVGRLATAIATVLMGKHKPEYTPHCDTGDFVVVLNAQNVRFTGKPLANENHPHFTKKFLQKTYERYSGYPGGRTVVNAADMMEKHPEKLLEEAVRRMLPKNKLARKMLSKLKLYTSTEHPHQAQQPEEFPSYLLSGTK